MKKIGSFSKICTKLMLVLFFLMGSVLTAQTVHPKLEKNGKFKAKKHKSADHHNKEVKKNQNHKVKFSQHSQEEYNSFSKKKKKKIKVQ